MRQTNFLLPMSFNGKDDDFKGYEYLEDEK